MRRIAFFAYACGCYLLFLATYVYLAGFVGNFFVPKTIDSGPAVPLIFAAAVNLGLIAVFGLQHSVMARPAFKDRWTKWVPHSIERATYVLLSCAALIALMWLWQPMNVVIWEVQN